MMTNFAEQCIGESNVLTELGNLWSRNVFGTVCDVKITDLPMINPNKLDYFNNESRCSRLWSFIGTHMCARAHTHTHTHTER